ncbi:MAG: MBL fold metallo-hydrolase [Clostridia bacterium]|nr:MBL fold metallo-hydrolase [Clostridia bacterium]
MKKRIRLICFLLLAVLALTACDVEEVSPTEEDTTAAIPVNTDLFPLAQDGKFVFAIVTPTKTTASFDEAVNKFANSLQMLSGGKNMVEILLDKQAATKEYEICVGNTGREESVEEWAKLEGDFDYRIKVFDQRVTVVAKSESSIAKALDELLNAIRSEASGKGGNFGISKSYQRVGVVNTAFPGLNQTGTFKGEFDCGDGSSILYCEDVTEADYEAYLDFLNSKGGILKKTYTLGSENKVNRYALIKGGEYTAYCSYLPTVNAMRIYVGGAGDTDLPESVAAGDAVKPVSLWQLEVDTKGSKANGGMSYVIQLADGTYLVIDGGYNTKAESDRLYQLLLENKPASHEKPIITAWFITHLHVDHYGCLNSMTTHHLNDVEVRGFYFNFPYITIGDLGAINAKSVTMNMKRWSGAVLYGKLHSGMSIAFPGVDAEIICTYEDVFPLAHADGNDTSMSFILKVGEQKILFLGDSEASESVTMETTLPEDVLKCDILQFAHHGYEGCNKALYVKADPTVVLWPMNVVGWQGKESYSKTPDNVISTWYRKLSANKYIWDSTSVKKIILSGEGTQKISFPYQLPTSRTRPNLDAIYSTKKKEQQEK